MARQPKHVSMRVEIDWRKGSATITKADWTKPERDGVIEHIGPLKKAQRELLMDMLLATYYAGTPKR